MPKVMIVDDSLLSRTIIRDLLERAGHQVVEAQDGLEALESYHRERPDAVLMDITMPRMSGLEALVALRRSDPTARVAMLTAMAQMETALKAVQMGARDFVVKPFDTERVLLAVTRMLDAGPRRERERV